MQQKGDQLTSNSFWNKQNATLQKCDVFGHCSHLLPFLIRTRFVLHSYIHRACYGKVLILNSLYTPQLGKLLIKVYTYDNSQCQPREEMQQLFPITCRYHPSDHNIILEQRKLNCFLLLGQIKPVFKVQYMHLA